MKTLFFSSLLAVVVMSLFVAIINVFGFEGLFNIILVSFVVGMVVEMIYSHIEDKKAAKAKAEFYKKLASNG